MSEGNRRLGRRTAMKLIGGTAALGVGAAGTSAARRRGPAVVRLKGSFGSPIGQAEQRERFEKLVTNNPHVAGDPLQARGRSEPGGDQRMVDVVMGIDETGVFARHREQAAQDVVGEAHENATRVAQQYRNGNVGNGPGEPGASRGRRLGRDGTIRANVDPDLGRDWVRFFDDTAKVSDHWGALNHNIQWYNVSTTTDDDGDEHNAIVDNIASSDDTISPYSRWIDAEHRWGSTSDLSGMSLWDAAPNTTSGDGSVTVGVGYPPSASLSYTFDSAGSITQDGSPPTTTWNQGIPRDGRSWFYPASHVESDAHSSGDDLITAYAETTWGAAYLLSHKWNLDFA